MKHVYVYSSFKLDQSTRDGLTRGYALRLSKVHTLCGHVMVTYVISCLKLQLFMGRDSGSPDGPSRSLTSWTMPKGGTGGLLPCCAPLCSVRVCREV